MFSRFVKIKRIDDVLLLQDINTCKDTYDKMCGTDDVNNINIGDNIFRLRMISQSANSHDLDWETF